MLVTGPSVFLPRAHGASAWEIAAEQAFRPGRHLMSPGGVGAEMAVRELVARSAYTLDQADIEGVLRLYTDDCVIDHTHGTLVGKRAIRSYYDQLFRQLRHSLHLWSNVVVRLAEGLDEGRVTAYIYAMLEFSDGTACAKAGVVADQIVKHADGWKICARSVAMDLTYGLASVEILTASSRP